MRPLGQAPVSSAFRLYREDDAELRCATLARQGTFIREDLQTQAVVELFRRAWQKQQQAATFYDDEHPDRMGGIGEELVRIYWCVFT